MNQAHATATRACPAPPRIGYRNDDPARALREPGTLAVVRFGRTEHAPAADARLLDLALPALSTPAPIEHWHVDDEVEHGREGRVGFAAGGGWLFASVEVAEIDHDNDIGLATETAYAELCRFLARRPDGAHVQRLWNYLDRINEGEEDAERYKRFCHGRLRGMGESFRTGFPAATAIGHPHDSGRVTVYCLASACAGTRIGNPRQMSPWRYPRRYGRTPPSFARAMRLPGDDALAISGTAAIQGHESRHTGDLKAQLQELAVNLDALLETAAMPAGFDANATLKAYVRHAADAPGVHAFLDQHMPDTPHVLLHGDICRRELLVEVDGWRYGWGAENRE